MKDNKSKQWKLARQIQIRENLKKLAQKYKKKESQNNFQSQANHFEQLSEIATSKLKMLNWPINPKEPFLPQLMLAVINPETPDNLPLSMYDREEMFQEVVSLLRYPDMAVEEMLELDEDAKQELALNLSRAKTAEDIRELLIMDILYEAMCNALDHFPNKNHMRINPIENSPGEAFI